jgi:hypothetical protein
MKIVILEDNADRRLEMQRCLLDKLPSYEPVFFDAPRTTRAFLEAHLAEVICISLDHDMVLVEGCDDRLCDPGTGREVADLLATRKPQCPVVIHTTNTVAAEGMEQVLQDAHWRTYRVAPWGDLEWVRSVWIQTIRRAIVDAALPRSDAGRDGGVAEACAKTAH